MEIIVQSIFGRHFTLDVVSSNSIEDVKVKIQDKLGFHPNQMRLIFNGKSLAEGRTLAYYNFKNGSLCFLSHRKY